MKNCAASNNINNKCLTYFFFQASVKRSRRTARLEKYTDRSWEIKIQTQNTVFEYVLEWFSPAGTHNNYIQEEDKSAERKRQTSFLAPHPPHEPKNMNFKLSWCRKLDNAEEKTHPSTIFSSEKKKNSRCLRPLLDSLSVVACTCGGTYKGYGGRGWRIRDRRRRDGRESEEGAAIIRHALVVKRTDSATLLFTICLLIVQQVLTTYNDAGDRIARRNHNSTTTNARENNTIGLAWVL